MDILFSKKVISDDEWIWVDGYKGTDEDMKCHDFQYELNKQFDMPEDVKIKSCLYYEEW